MRKTKNSKIFVAALLLLSVLLSGVFPVISAASVQSAESENESATTQYGVIPSEHADKNFVVFSEGVCIGSANEFNGDNGLDASGAKTAIRIARDSSYNGKTAQILMLRDYTPTGSDYYNNLAQCKAEVTIDLGGHTFTAKNIMLSLQTKAHSDETKFVLKNGNLVIGNNPLLRYATYGEIDNKKMTLNCENVNFSLKSGSTVEHMISTCLREGNTALNAYFDINFTDCLFDVTNATKHITIFEADDTSDTTFENPITVKYAINNCQIKATSPDDFTVWGTFNANSSYSENGLKTNYVIYEEDFDAVNGKVELEAGNNLYGPAKGWIYAKKSTNSEAYIENGRLYFSGSKYDVIYRDGGEVWGNYTLEADFCYLEETVSTGWGGMLYNVQSDTKFQKGGISLAKKYSLNGKNGSTWSNDKSGVNKGFSLPGDVEFGIGTPTRMKITVHNKSASFYYAMLDENGNMKTDFIHLLTINNIPADAQTGSIGFMTSNNNLASFWVDNIKCYSEGLVSYSESFDSYGDVTLEADANNSSIGVYFDKSDSLASGGAEIKNGALHLSGGGKNFNAIFFNMGKNWTNYVLESDLTYVSEANNAGWGGLLFRATDIDNFWKGAINVPTDSSKGTGSLNCQLGGAWYLNSDTGATYSQGPLKYGETVRVRIEVNEKVAKLYAARYTDGTLGEWVHVKTTVSEDKFAAEHMQGTIGLIVGGSADTKEKHIYVDNMTVSRIPGADRMHEAPNAATIYEPTTGIVNPPVVVEKLTATLPATEGERAAIVITEIDASLNVLDKNGAVITTVDSFIDTYRSVLIPAFLVDNEAEADALATLLYKKNLIDAYVVATAENAALVKRVRLANDATKSMSGALIFDDLNSLEARKEARALVVDNMSYVAISRAPLSEEAAFYFAARQVAAWGFADSTAEVYRGIANGYHGIVSESVSEIYDVYESITEPTVSGETVVIAHRGANTGADVDYPENTLMGIRAAKEIWGADGIEIDFGLTKDGYIVIMHDTTVDRTTDGTGKVSDFTLAEIKALTVDYVEGKETTVPTLEEVLILAKEIDVVLYCHVKDKTDANIAAFSYLVEKYDCADRVLLFNSSYDSFNSNTDRVYSGTGYELSNHPVLIDGIQFTSGNQTILSGCETYLEGVVEMKNLLNKYNYQPLFYPYLNQGAMWSAETFYYQLCARGFVNTHSITDGQAKMDKLALTESGAVGWLTNNPHLSDDYHYAIDLSGEKLTLTLGETINLSKTLKLIMGTANAECGLVQVGGKTLVSTSEGYTLNEAGKATVVYYATRTTDGGSTYRIYSEPIELTFVSESLADFKPMSSITLGSELVYNVYVPVSDMLKSFTLDGVTYTDFEALKDIVTINANNYYHFAIELPSAEAARSIVLSVNITVDGADFEGSFTMSVPKYAKKVMNLDAASEYEKTLAKDVLAYVKAAYSYFTEFNTAEEIARVNALIDSIIGDYKAEPVSSGVTNTVSPVTSVTLNLDSKPSIRFYVTDTNLEFYANGRKLNTVTGTDATYGAYVELDVYAYVLAETITYGNGGSYHISDFLEGAKGTNYENLVACFIKYTESAADYRNYVVNN
ncbi:MAG: glycerophosphodiester phosphodiesterase family protein [Ruminococcaceae bacterium]|nr:glycerophosphodiester phosphodiesterase family protein [Oscillospiraceae bacterium]